MLSNEKFKKLLSRFLKDEGIYEMHKDKFLLDESCYKYCGNLFDYTITWNWEAEGFNFWYEKHLKWKCFLKKNGVKDGNNFDHAVRDSANMHPERKEMFLKYRRIFDNA